MSYANKVVAITGGAGVLCSGFARYFAQQGAKVAILDRAEDAARQLADEITAQGGLAMGLFCDVLKADSLQQAHQAIQQAWGPVDILINGAGGNNPRATTDSEQLADEDLLESAQRKTFFNLSAQDISFVFDLNILGTILPSQVFGRSMAERRAGCILNISSMNAYRPLTKIPAYSGAKAAVSNFTRWLAVHLSPVGVRVNAIAPGFFVTKQNQSLLYNPDGTPTARTGKILAATPMGRFGQPQELNGAVDFLCDDQRAGFITGVILPIDGGFSAYSGV